MAVSTFGLAVNDFKTTLPVPHAAGAATLVLQPGDGARLGTLPASRIYRVTAVLNPETIAEAILAVVEATGISADTLTGVTGAEGSGNIALAAGVTIEVRVTAKGLSEVQAAINALESAPAPPPSYAAPNVDSAALAALAPVAVAPGGVGVVRAAAGAIGTAAAGLCLASTAPGASATVVTSGPVTLADWTAVAGTVTLAARGYYFLGPAAGTLTTTPPTAPGQVVQGVGTAVSGTTLDLTIQPPILL
jgi:hypothetical protein